MCSTCRTLEEMDEVFDSGFPAWKTSNIRSARLEQLADEFARDSKATEMERGVVPGVTPQTVDINDDEK